MSAGLHPIAEQLVVTRGNVTGLLQRLQNKGLLSSRLNERDGRSFLCLLTADGRAVLERARAAASLFIEAQLSPFNDAELAETESMMRHMRSHLEAMDTDAMLASIESTGEPPPAEAP